MRIEILDDGALRFFKPSGAAIDNVAGSETLGDWKCLTSGPRAAPARWTGESMDYDLGVEVLMQQAKRAKNVPAGT